MNLFVLSLDVFENARWLVDTHVHKMCVEYTQMCAAAYHMEDAECKPPRKKDGTLYRRGYWHHPASVWARETEGNWWWLLRSADALTSEYRMRFGKPIACSSAIGYMFQNPASMWLDSRVRRPGLWNIPLGPDLNMTKPPLCMPDEFKLASGVIDSYRNYYANGKKHLHEWTPPGHRPEWLESFARTSADGKLCPAKL